MKKHAYLVIAHNEPKLFHTLLSCLDDKRNDIFVLIDAKSNIDNFMFCPQYSNISYVDRVDIRWGDISLVVAELILMEAAILKDRYDYYHLLSGVDLPIKSQDYIHSFFDDLQSSKELVSFVPDKDVSWRLRIDYYIPFLKYQKSSLFVIRLMTKICRDVFLFFQKSMGYRRKWDMEMKKGAQWFSITDEFCRYVVSQKDFIIKKFRNVSCIDEVFMQTLLYNWNRHKIYNQENEIGGALREIDWNRGLPYTWGKDNYDIVFLRNSKCLFARKFSSNYPQIIETVVKELNNDNE